MTGKGSRAAQSQLTAVLTFIDIYLHLFETHCVKGYDVNQVFPMDLCLRYPQAKAPIQVTADSPFHSLWPHPSHSATQFC